MENYVDAIVTEALRYVGEEEIKGNMGFKNPEFERKMATVGFQKTHAWCSYLAELVWKGAYKPKGTAFIDTLDKLFSASAVVTYNNFKAHPSFMVTKTPSLGALAVWQKYENGVKHWTGHIGIVIDVDGQKMVCVEGNTNNAGGREGFVVAKKKRNVTFAVVPDGLTLLGFIHTKN